MISVPVESLGPARQPRQVFTKNCDTVFEKIASEKISPVFGRGWSPSLFAISGQGSLCGVESAVSTGVFGTVANSLRQLHCAVCGAADRPWRTHFDFGNTLRLSLHRDQILHFQAYCSPFFESYWIGFFNIPQSYFWFLEGLERSSPKNSPGIFLSPGREVSKNSKIIKNNASIAKIQPIQNHRFPRISKKSRSSSPKIKIP